MTFQRARTAEQREARRRTILATAIQMLGHTSVRDMSLNELSRRSGLAKSNVLRYFDSREAVLLDVLDDLLTEWVTSLTSSLGRRIHPSASIEERACLVANTFSDTLAERTLLCDLFGAQGSVLERNVSIETVKRHKRASLAHLTALNRLVRTHLPEIEDKAEWFCLMSLITAGALSSYVPPPATLIAAYEDEPALGTLNLDLRDALTSTYTTALRGAIPR